MVFRFTILYSFFFASFCGSVHANILLKYLPLNKVVKADVGTIVPPKEIKIYQKKIQAAADADPDWFRDYRKTAKPGLPYPFNEKMGMTKEDYAEYIRLWSLRKFEVIAAVEIKLVQRDQETYTLIGSGPAAKFSRLKYKLSSDSFSSLNGTLSRIEDIDADPLSIIGKWTGHEWKFKGGDEYATIKENFAIGVLADQKNGILVYRFQELSKFAPYEENILLRFPLNP